ncbi:MAG TPA: hypothetical protein VHO67_06545 [Polyangia bacterium]|nr:hypothetical protein [Polyangia bacterium]
MNERPPLRSLLASSCSFVAVAAALVTSGGCGRVPGQFEILNDQVPTSGDSCTIPVAETVYQGTGTLDVSIVRSSFSTAYLFFPLIENNLPGSGAPNDPNQIHVTAFDVDIGMIGSTTPGAQQVMNNADPALLHFQVPWSGGVSSNGGHISAAVEAVPVDLALQLAGAGGLSAGPGLRLNLKIQARGTTNSGRSLVSDPFDFPVEVCNGCLVGNVAPCPYKPTNTGNACNPAQDDVVDCCTQNGNLICPAQGGTSS